MVEKHVTYERPPVVEVVCGVVFDCPQLRTAHLGQYWGSVADQYPSTEDKPPLMEAPGFSRLPPARRLWCWSKERDWLIQLQLDRFLMNWKRDTSLSTDYIRFEPIFRKFLKTLDHFSQFVRNATGNELEIKQHELTYVNIINERNGLAEIGPFDVLLDHARVESDLGRFLPPPTTFNWADTFTLPGGAGQLHISARNHQEEDVANQGIRIDLSARGALQNSEENELNKWFEQAHEWIVKGFTDITNPQLHVVWRRQP